MMNAFQKLSDHLQRISNGKNFLMLLVAYSIYFPIFFFSSLPFALPAIEPFAAGKSILDVELFYTAEEAYQRLALFGESGRAVYLNILMGDLLYPALLGGLLGISITLLFRRLDFSRRYWQYLGLLPLANMALDYVEDALLLSLLYSYPDQLTLAASAAGFITLAKNIFGLLAFLALGYGLLAVLVQRIQRYGAR